MRPADRYEREEFRDSRAFRNVAPIEDVIPNPVREQKLGWTIPAPFEMRILVQHVSEGLTVVEDEEQSEFRSKAFRPDQAAEFDQRNRRNAERQQEVGQHLT